MLKAETVQFNSLTDIVEKWRVMRVPSPSLDFTAFLKGQGHMRVLSFAIVFALPHSSQSRPNQGKITATEKSVAKQSDNKKDKYLCNE